MITPAVFNVFFHRVKGLPALVAYIVVPRDFKAHQQIYAWIKNKSREPTGISKAPVL
jgi:hypothetical protein